jgi:CBS domain-containing protein
MGIVVGACGKVGGLPVMQGDELVGIVTETDVLNYLIELLKSGDEIASRVHNDQVGQVVAGGQCHVCT